MRAVVSAFILANLMGVAAAHAADAPTGAAALLSASCTGCHTTQTDSDNVIPNLDGYTADDIRAALVAFREDNNATVMNRIARGYSDSEIDQIASYLGSGD